MTIDRDAKLVALRKTDAELIDEVKSRIDPSTAHRLTRNCRLEMKDDRGWKLELSVADLVSLVILECSERMSAGEFTLLPFKPSVASDGDQHEC